VARRFLIAMIVFAIAAGAAWWVFGREQASDSVAEPAPGAPAPAMPERPADAFAMTVESVHDGDTLRAHVETPNAVVSDTASTRVRLLGIDTPEISPVLDCWGVEATAGLVELAPPGSTIWVSPDVEVLDQYGRHLLYLWSDDGRFINGELVARGDARTEIYRPNTLHETLLRGLEEQAVAAGAGQWAACR
jgi:micrococcal nuclease